MYTKNFPGAWALTALLLAFTACHKEPSVPPAEAATGKLSLRLDGLDIQKTDPNGRTRPRKSTTRSPSTIPLAAAA